MRLLLILICFSCLAGCNTPPPATAPTPQATAESVQSLFQSALHKLRMNDAEGGIDDLKRAAELEPDNPEVVEAYMVVALRMRKLGRVEDGLRVIELALEMEPGKAHFWQAKGSFLFAGQKPSEAREALLKARELAPEDPNIFYDMGWQASQSEATYAQALEDYSEAIKLDPKMQRAWANRGALRNRMGDYQEALNDLDQALKLDPNDSLALYEKATALLNSGRKKEASEYAQKVVDLNQNPQAAALARSLLGDPK